MKKFLKMTVLLGLLLLVLLTAVSCKNIIEKIPFLNNNDTENTSPEATTPEATTPTHTHTFGDWTITQNATCTEKGQQERTCSCGENETQEINALGHTEVADEAVSHTCTTDGLTAGSHCSTCGEVFTAQEVIPAAHDWMQVALLESATCFTYGEERRACRVCDIVENAPVEPLKHNFVLDEESQYHTCSLCNGILFAGHVYAAFEGAYHWFDAYKLCEDMGGHLVTVTSEREQAVINHLMNSELRQAEVYLFGGIRLTDGFHWITEEPFEYTHWNPGQPNFSGGNQYFLATYSYRVDSAHIGLWEDVDFQQKFAFICEWEPDITDCEHTFTEWEITTEATCWNDGEQYRLCTYCGVEETQVLNQLEHNFILSEETNIELCEHCKAAKHNGHIYVLFTEKCSWFDAYSHCDALGGHLATITSEEEQAFVASYMEALDTTALAYTWLGGYSDGNNWHWVTDEAFEYTNWNAGEPNNTSGREWIVHIYPGAAYKWNDGTPMGLLAYLCEFECEK